MARVVLAMSGGVDSSVAAWLLRRQGHEVVGLFMRHGVEAPVACTPSAESPTGKGTEPFALLENRDGPQRKSDQAPSKQGCCSVADAADARRVADALEIPFYVLNFEAEFGRIIDYFTEEYTAGRTPNPCIVCNTWLKFGKLFEYADSLGAEFVATGHHARIVPTDDPMMPALCAGQDAGKDQSYVLFGVDRQLLRRLSLPVGEHHKDAIRQIAAELGLRVAEKKDSQEICFVHDGDHARLVRQRRGPIDTSGEIVTTAGEVVGRHSGLEQFTVGQRKGLKVAFGERRFVVRLEPETRRVVVGTRDELARRELVAARANWLIEPPQAPLRCRVKIRYRTPPVEAFVEPLAGDRFHVVMDEPSHGIAPGQAAVCYDGDRVLGGGWIE